MDSVHRGPVLCSIVTSLVNSPEGLDVSASACETPSVSSNDDSSSIGFSSPPSGGFGGGCETFSVESSWSSLLPWAGCTGEGWLTSHAAILVVSWGMLGANPPNEWSSSRIDSGPTPIFSTFFGCENPISEFQWWEWKFVWVYADVGPSIISWISLCELCNCKLR